MTSLRDRSVDGERVARTGFHPHIPHLSTLSRPAQAAGEPCSAAADCSAGELCFESECTPTDEPITACPDVETADQVCAGWDTCVDGECKRNDPACRNDLGVCYFGAETGECQCTNAPGIEWLGDPPDLGEFDDLEAQCFATLADTCPTEIPEPTCDDDEQREECESFVARENELRGTCGGSPQDDPLEVSLAVSSCCGDFDVSGIAEYRICVLGLDTSDCAGLEACGNAEPGDGGGTPVNADDETTQDEGTAQDEDTSGCRVGGSGGSLLGLMVASLGLMLRRRRSPACHR